MKVPVPDPVPGLADLGRVHLVGIGGAGLSGIARIMLGRGTAVSGSDGTDSPTLQALRDLGATVHVGHDAAHVRDVDTLVVSTAVPEDNPEVVEALRRGLRVLPRSAGLAAAMQGPPVRRVVAVAGTHGKTTTTSLLTVALQAAGADPSYAIGGDLAATGVNAAVGAGEVFVAEADESDGAFLVYDVQGAIVTNVDADHLDQWGTPEAYAAAFDRFADGLPTPSEDPDAFLVCCVDDPGAAALADRHESTGRRVVRVSTADDEALGDTVLWAPGDHYRADALAALAAGEALGFARADLLRGIASYTGTRRRMERKGEVGGVVVYDSYAHHPSEIDGDLQSARLLAGEGRLVVAFQPHLVSRTRIFGRAMGRALGAADEVVVLDLYLAREAPDPAVTSALVADAVPLPEGRVHRASLEDAAGVLAGLAGPGDLVLTLGAGTVTRVGPELVARLGHAGSDGTDSPDGTP